MDATATKKKPFYGWVVVAILCLVNMVPMVLVQNYSSFFQLPVCETLGATYAEFSIGALLGSLAGMVFNLTLAGRLGRGSIRVWMTVCMLIGAVGIFLQSMMTEIWQYWILQAIISFAYTGVTFLPINTLMARWFVDKKALATGIVFAGSGVGGFFLSPMLSDWIATLGWRTSYVIIAVVTAIIAVLVFIFVSNDPKDKGQTPLMPKSSGEADVAVTNAAATATGLSKKEALKTPALWFLMISIFAGGVLSASILTQVPTFVAENGGNYAIVMMCYSVASLVAKFILGPIFDRFGVIIGGSLIGILDVGCLVSFLLMGVGGDVAACFGAAMLGFNAVATFVGPLLTGKLFGYFAYADVYGLVNMAFMFGAMVGPTIAASARTFSGTYEVAWIVMIAFVIIYWVAMILSNKMGQNLTKEWHS